VWVIGITVIENRSRCVWPTKQHAATSVFVIFGQRRGQKDYHTLKIFIERLNPTTKVSCTGRFVKMYFSDALLNKDQESEDFKALRLGIRITT